MSDQIKIKLSGDGHAICINPSTDPGDLDYNLILTNVKLEVAGDDITKLKGEDILSKNPLTEDALALLDEVEEVIYLRKQSFFETEFTLPVSEGEFNPKLLQLVVSDNEIESFPYAIMSDRIVYDGIQYETDTAIEEANSTLPEDWLGEKLNTEFNKDPFEDEDEDEDE